MRISIGHVSRYSYAEPTSYIVQTLRLTPPVFESQRVLEWSISAPGIEKARKFRDGFGNDAHLVSYSGLHDNAVVIAKGVVETADHAGIVRGLPEIAPIRVFMRETEMTRPDAALQDLAARVGSGDAVARLHELMHTVRQAVDYKIGTTTQHTTAASALAKGEGVCQDHAHVFITCARIIGFPARYVNGYFISGEDDPSEAHHAWAEVWVDDVGWIGFDAANLVCPTDRYVRLATGLDAVSAAPIRGTRRGGANETLDVIVEVQQHSSQQQ